MGKTLKSMTAAECNSERSRNRHDLGFLALKRMRPETTAAERAVIDARILKIRRRLARLDRRIEQIADRQAAIGKDAP